MALTVTNKLSNSTLSPQLIGILQNLERKIPEDIQCGTATNIGSLINDYFRYIDVTFPHTFAGVPTVCATLVTSTYYADQKVSVYNVSPAGFRIIVEYPNGNAKNGSFKNRNATWIAILMQ